MHTPNDPASSAPAPSKPAASCPFARLFGSKPASLADMLREKTKDAHTRAEKHPVQARLVKGEAARADYAAWLGQMHHLWCAVDAATAKLAARDARVAAIVKPYHPHAHRVAADLAFLGHAPADFPAVLAASDFSMWLSIAAANTDTAVIGAWYVLEGSANGGRYIAKAVSRSLNLPGPEGLTALDPHGDSQRERWAAWKADLDAQAWNGHERDAVIAAAARTFDAIHDMMEQMPNRPAATVVMPAPSC
jgi:heme oxygenase